jgi:hypothetical protein
MALIVRIMLNDKMLRCYGARRITNPKVLKPTGTTNVYEIVECASHMYARVPYKNIIGTVEHNYDEPPEILAYKTLSLVLEKMYPTECE